MYAEKKTLAAHDRDAMQNRSAADMVLGGATAPTPVSPIQRRLMDQASLLTELVQEIDQLADAVATVMQDDPRDEKETGLGEACTPVSCQLESRISDANGLISSSLTLLRRIRNSIQL